MKSRVLSAIAMAIISCASPKGSNAAPKESDQTPADTLRDRLAASRMGDLAVKLLLAGESNKVICEINSQIVPVDINYALIDTIKMSKTPIIGINIGQCASAAAYIFLSCHKRYMLPHAYFILHQGSGTLSGTFEQICAQMEDY